MNYRHIFHAGNHTEVFKHAALVHLIKALQRKRAPLFVLDTHAGPGCSDLESAEAQKTREAEGGILEVASRLTSTVVSPYLQIVRKYNDNHIRYYPGSPAICAALLRPQDRLAACELHPGEFQKLRSFFGGTPNVGLHGRDGYEAMLALVPPPERRGVVFVDPPFEAKSEFGLLASKLLSAYRKWATGTFVAWYPIKAMTHAENFKGSLQAGIPSNCLSVELLREAPDGIQLAGSGLVIINPPWQFDELLKGLCSELLNALDATKGGSWRVEWISAPK